MSVSRRRLLQLAGASLAVPFLRPPLRSFADTGDTGDTGAPIGTVPKRLIVFHMPQGTVMNQFVPMGTETDFMLPLILQPLAPWQDRINIITGADNYSPRLNSVGNAHQNANLTFLTGRPFHVQDANALSAGGPTIDQVVADRICTTTPYKRLDFAVGGNETANGLVGGAGGDGGYFWHGINDPVAAFNDPTTALIRIFGDSSITPAEAWAIRSRRSSVLDNVMRGFQRLRPRLGAEDSVRLDAHEDKVAQLYDRMVSGTGECARPNISFGAGYQYGQDDNLTAPALNDVMVTALSCDYTRVATLRFENAHDHPFRWLNARNGGQPIVDLNLYDNWHAMVHDDYVPGAEWVYQWYHQMLADLLHKLDTTVDADGDNMLDTTMVMCVSEFSSGRHWNTSLPFVFAGNFGDAAMGRWLNYLTLSADDFQESGGYAYSFTSVNQVYVSLLNAFGFSDTVFGYEGLWDGNDMPQGPLPGLL